jgi:hypothetical protein
MTRDEDTSGNRRAETELEQQRSREALEAGGLPLAAAERLRRFGDSDSDSPFSSSLSVNEFGLLHRLGIRPLVQVMGASVFQHGWRNLPRDVWSNVAGNSPRMFGGLGGLSGLGGAGRDSGAWSSEWRQISDPFNDARERAVGRLRLEAEAAGADAVLGVRLRRTGRAFAGEGTVEFTAVGTAVRLPEALRTGAARRHPNDRVRRSLSGRHPRVPGRATRPRRQEGDIPAVGPRHARTGPQVHR